MPLPTPESIAAKAHLLPLLRAAIKAANEGRFDTAEQLIQSLLEQDPRMADAVHMQAYMALHRGQLSRAVELARQAIELDFHYENYHLTLGQALLGLGDTAGAIKSFGAALGLNPKFLDAYLALAHAHIAAQDYAAALGVLRQAKLIDGTNAKLRFLIGHVSGLMQDTAGAVRSLALAVQLEPGNNQYRSHYARALRKMKLKRPDPALIASVLPLLGVPGVEPRDLTGVVESALRMDPDITTLWSLIEQPPEIAAALISTPAFPPLSDNQLLLRWLRHGLVSDYGLEQLLTVLRRSALWLGLAKPDAMAPHTGWLEALAHRNFHAEYLDTETPEERNHLAGLDEILTATIASGAMPSSAHLALYACYRPLYRRADAAVLAAMRWPVELGALRRTQLDEPLSEREIAAAMPSVTPIDDHTSRHVREMYEESPFPRWSQPIFGGDTSMGMALRVALPRQTLPEISVEAPDVLVAGCGTGLHAILAATHYRGAKVLAVDLSRASLAYGKRKAAELGIGNIRFGHADILKLGGIAERFDLIESFGVLHHMREPDAGLAQLAKLLKPGGYMMLGLYSEVGRRDVVLARGLIAKHRYSDTPDDIRRFRTDLRTLDPDLAARLQQSSAFHSLPDFRDLVFHRQEHRYYPEQLGPLVAGAGLRFLGFEFGEAQVLRDYLALYPDDPQAVNLANWAAFERDHPALFANCFRFWVDKPL